MKVVIVTGMSGAGKTNAADWFEDKGYYVVDNMPPALIKNFIELTIMNDNKIKEAAFVVDIRGGEFFNDLKECILNLKSYEDVELKTLFLEASDAALIRRFNETRRHHPLSESATSIDVLTAERSMLKEIRANCDYIIDTSNLKVAGLKAEMDSIFLGNSKSERFTINVISFGFKYGMPLESDMVLDMRFIPNPFYVPSLKRLTGNNKKVSQYVLKFEITQEFIKRTRELIERMIPCYMKEGKYNLNIAFGCTGGHHRSVVLANEMSRVFEEDGYRVTLEHRDL